MNDDRLNITLSKQDQLPAPKKRFGVVERQSRINPLDVLPKIVVALSASLKNVFARDLVDYSKLDQISPGADEMAVTQGRDEPTDDVKSDITGPNLQNVVNFSDYQDKRHALISLAVDIDLSEFLFELPIHDDLGSLHLNPGQDFEGLVFIAGEVQALPDGNVFISDPVIATDLLADLLANEDEP